MNSQNIRMAVNKFLEYKNGSFNELREYKNARNNDFLYF